jgi:hypothetical protein
LGCTQVRVAIAERAAASSFSKKYNLDIYFNVQYTRSMMTLGILGGWSVLRTLEDYQPYLLLSIVPPMSTRCSKGGPS